jgi:hypothetical protein
MFIELDNAASSELISKNHRTNLRFVKVCPHMHISSAICVQSVLDSRKE